MMRSRHSFCVFARIGVGLWLGGCSLDWSKHAAHGAVGDAGVDAASALPHEPFHPGPHDAGPAHSDAMPPMPQAHVDCDDAHPCPTDYACVNAHCQFVPPPRLPSSLAQTSGGGVAASAGHVVRIAAGAPQPFGVTRSENFQLRLGPRMEEP